MTTCTPNPRQLEQLFQDLEDGGLNAEDHAWLMDLMRENPKIRQAYLEHMALATGLHGLAEAWGPGQEMVAIERPEIRERRMMRRSFLAAAAVVALLAGIGSFIAIRDHLRPHVSVVPGVATKWRFQNGGLAKNGGFMPATRVAVDSGTLEITTRDETRILLEGPAEMEIHDRLHVSLAGGKGWFDVAPEDRGFTVVTEHLRVVDFGTRFGVATYAGSDRVQVDSGHIRLDSRVPGVAPMDLRTGQAARADLAGRSARADYDPGLFLSRLPEKPVEIHWSFDKLENGEFPAAASGFKPAGIRVVGFGNRAVTPKLVPGRFGSALDLSEGDSFAMSDFSGISGRGPRTVAFWLRSKPIPRRFLSAGRDYTPAVLIWGDPRRIGGIWSIRAHTVAGLIGTQWDSNNLGWTIGGKHGSQTILDDQWHHVASVFTGKTDETGNVEIRHFIDGKRVETVSSVLECGVDTHCDKSAESNLRLGYDGQNPAGPLNSPLAIDELRVFRSPLSDEQIEELFRENRVSAGE